MDMEIVPMTKKYTLDTTPISEHTRGYVRVLVSVPFQKNDTYISMFRTHQSQ